MSAFRCAILAAFGTVRLGARVRRPWLKYVVSVVLCGVVLFESRATLDLVPVPAPHPVYRWFDGRPSGVVAELPAANSPVEPAAIDVRYSYPATFHWQRILNGNSGTFPMSNRRFCVMMQPFPASGSLAFLFAMGVDYVVIHEEYTGSSRYAAVVAAVGRCPELQEVARASDGAHEARIYRLIK